MTKAPGPPSSGAYHHPVPTVTMVWEALCRKPESKRNRSGYWTVWREYTRVLGVMFVEQCVSIPVCRLFKFLPCPSLPVQDINPNALKNTLNSAGKRNGGSQDKLRVRKCKKL